PCKDCELIRQIQRGATLAQGKRSLEVHGRGLWFWVLRLPPSPVEVRTFECAPPRRMRSWITPHGRASRSAVVVGTHARPRGLTRPGHAAWLRASLRGVAWPRGLATRRGDAAWLRGLSGHAAWLH